jgi:hypothetical protein
MWASFGNFLITTYRNRHSPKPMELYSIKPYSIDGDCLMPFFHSLVDIKIILIYHQQPFPHEKPQYADFLCPNSDSAMRCIFNHLEWSFLFASEFSMTKELHS